nr:6907_t:CDS:2 [Entrophospora candida]
MSVTNLKNFAYNILKTFGDTIENKEFPELKQCSECNKEFFSHPLKGFTTSQCGHVFHRICIEKYLLITNICPFPKCDQNSETIIDTSRQDSQPSTPSIVRGMSNQLQINTEVIQEDEEMDDVDELGRIKELKDNNTHQDLSFTSQSPEANSYIHLYQEIVKAEAENDTTNRRARDKVVKEVEEQP